MIMIEKQIIKFRINLTLETFQYKIILNLQNS